ncbi:hypothetical protein TSUD_14960 [Trifolium subterraneum]|uniref:Glutaredoxin-dependent peroxiredoxin n=1 Tax=Trifolium subterraneum TaxID=3900 RepID=A0A2Z6MT98_TRISU|nr:hypothetical protein TSUD_14960 [Trifolium subterraneum]
MAPIEVGNVIPNGTLTYLDDTNNIQYVSIHSFAANKKVIILGVLGAFTPICISEHVSSFIEISEILKAKGIDEIICISVNDPFVMNAWNKTFPENKHVKFFADGSATYARALGLEIDLSEFGLGVRSKRFSLLVDNLKVKVAKIEGGGQFTISSAQKIIKAL